MEQILKCDVCGDSVRVVNDDFRDHNRRNYVRHVFLSHRDDRERVAIIQGYIDNYLGRDV